MSEPAQPAREDIIAFLASSPVFRDMPPDELTQMAAHFQVLRFPAGSIILTQGGVSEGIYFLRSGTLAVRVHRTDWRETVATLNPPEIFGELSFLTGRACVADVEVVVDAEVLFLSKSAVPLLPERREPLLRGLLQALAGRLQQTVSRGARTVERPVVLLRNHPHWEAPYSFAFELARSLGRQTERPTVLVNIGTVPPSESELTGDASAVVCQMPVRISDTAVRHVFAEQIGAWSGIFENIILNPVGPEACQLAESLVEFANFEGRLLGPGDEVPPDSHNASFTVQSMVQPSLPVLDGRHQLIWEAAASEDGHRGGRSVSPRFLRTVDSVARSIAGLQVGIALGGGAAWGWAHIGVLDVIEKQGIPIDVITGCSMGSVIGALRASGRTPRELEEIAGYWCSRTLRFLEWRLWRLSLINEKKVLRIFRHYFGRWNVNETQIPYWANSVDIGVGKEFAIKDGPLVQCLRASISLPGLLPPAAREEHLLIDAGIMDPVPAKLLKVMRCDFAIGVNAMAALDKAAIDRRYPRNAIDIMTRSMFLMAHEIGQANAEKIADVVFTPELTGIAMLDFSRAPEIIERGRQAAEKHLPVIMKKYQRLKDRHKASSSPSPRPVVR